MQKGKPTYDFKWIIASIVTLIVVAFAFFFYWELTKVFIRWILEGTFTYFILWAAPICLFLLHYIRHKDKEVKTEPIITRKFGVFVDNALGGVSYATIIATSTTLLKGLYIQKFFDDKQYFTEFNDIDLMAVFGVASFLLYISLMKVYDIIMEIAKTQRTEKVLDVNKRLVTQKSDDEMILELAEEKSNEEIKITEEIIEEGK